MNRTLNHSHHILCETVRHFEHCRGSIDMIVVDGVTLPAKSHVLDPLRRTYLWIGGTSCRTLDPKKRCTTLPPSWFPYSQGQRERLFRSSHGKFTCSKDLRCHVPNLPSFWVRFGSLFLIAFVQCSSIILFGEAICRFCWSSDFWFLLAYPSLAKIVQQTGATIVLSSEWRTAFRRTPYIAQRKLSQGSACVQEINEFGCERAFLTCDIKMTCL